jgi:hypothetical protein
MYPRHVYEIFKEEDKRLLKELLPPHAPVPNNPVDFAAGVYEAMDEVRVIEKLASIDAIDGIITNIPMDNTVEQCSLAMFALIEYARIKKRS